MCCPVLYVLQRTHASLLGEVQAPDPTEEAHSRQLENPRCRHHSPKLSLSANDMQRRRLAPSRRQESEALSRFQVFSSKHNARTSHLSADSHVVYQHPLQAPTKNVGPIHNERRPLKVQGERGTGT